MARLLADDGVESEKGETEKVLPRRAANLDVVHVLRFHGIPLELKRPESFNSFDFALGRLPSSSHMWAVRQGARWARLGRWSNEK